MNNQFDIIGDIHGCYNELINLTEKLGYTWQNGILEHPNQRRLVFLGDLTDRGPNSLSVIDIVYRLVHKKRAHYTPGNHCDKLYRFFKGNKVKINNGLETTVEEYHNQTQPEKAKVKTQFMELYENAPWYLQLDDHRLVVAHAGIKEELMGKQGNKVKTFVLYGDITGETNPDGTPVRKDWAQGYKGNPWIVYGHTPVKEPRKVNKTYNIDTGAVFGGSLTALRYPELETVSVTSSMPFVEEKFKSFP